MAVNESIYGAAAQWYNSSFQQPALTEKNKVAYFGASILDRTLEKGVEAGKLSYSEGIDKSISYCGLGTESALSHIAYAANVNGDPALIDRQDRNVTNFGFFEKSSSAEVEPLTVYNFSDLRYIAWNAALNPNIYQFNRYLAPFTRIVPKNVVLAIYVYAAKNDYSDITVFTLNQYLNSYTTYPKIISAYVEAYIGNYAENVMPREILGGVPFGRYYIPFHLGLLEEYELESKDLRFYAYDFYRQSVFGNFSNSHLINNNNDFMPVAFTEKSYSHIKCEKVNNTCYVYTEYYPEFEQDILKTVACFGLYFTGDPVVASYGDLTHNDMYIGLLDENGIGHGAYLRGAQTVNAPQNDYSDMSQTGYDYQKETDNTKYINNTLFYGTWSSQAFTKMYVLTASEVSLLANELYTAVSQAPQGEEIERYNQSVFLTQNPIDCIISLKKFPMELPFSASVPIKLGSYTCQQATGAPLLYSTGVYTFTFSRGAQNSLRDWFEGSFLDYEQYTKVELSIPFCGTVEIPCCYLFDYDTLEVKLIVDFITGACTAYILSRGITIDSVSGECAVNLPVNGVQAANLDAQIYAAAANRNKSAFSSGLGLIGGLATMAIGIATGGIAAAVAGGIAAVASGTNMVVQDKKIEYELQHMQLPLKQISAASGAISQSYDMRCKMRITRPKLDPNFDPEVYADTVGYACLMQGQVKDFTGLTVGEIDLDGVAAPEPVKKMLQSLFAEGVYL